MALPTRTGATFPSGPHPENCGKSSSGSAAEKDGILHAAVELAKDARREEEVCGARNLGHAPLGIGADPIGCLKLAASKLVTDKQAAENKRLSSIVEEKDGHVAGLETRIQALLDGYEQTMTASGDSEAQNNSDWRLRMFAVSSGW